MNKLDQAFSIGGIELYASMLGRQNNMKVVFSGNRTCIDHTTKPMTIYLPGNLANTKKNRLIIESKTCHEAAHARYTDFSVPNWHDIVNILEDVRIERLMGNRYLGCKQVFSWQWDILVPQMRFPNEEDGLTANIYAMLMFTMRSQVLSHPLTDFAEKAERLVRNKVPGEVVDEVLTLAKKASMSASTHVVSECTRKILDLLTKDQPETQQPPKADESSQNDQSEGGSDASQDKKGDKGEEPEENEEGDTFSHSEHSDQNPESSEESPEGTSDKKASQSESGESADNQNDDTGKGKSPESSGEDKPDPKKTQSAGEAIQEAANSTPASGIGQQDSNQDDWRKELKDLENQLSTLDVDQLLDDQLEKGEYSIIRAEEVPKTQLPLYRIDEIQAQRISNRLRSEMQGLLQAMGMSREYNVMSGSHIDRRRLHTLRTPNPRPFLRKTEGKELNTAIQFLIDSSGSMAADMNYLIANEAAYALAEAIYHLNGVESATAYFKGGILSSVDEFGQKPDPAQFGIEPGGGTRLELALQWTLNQLWPRGEDRKIVIFLTDGQVSPEAIGKVEMLENNGIECYGIGIRQDLEAILSQAKQASITEIAELPKAMFTILKKALFKQ